MSDFTPNIGPKALEEWYDLGVKNEGMEEGFEYSTKRRLVVVKDKKGVETVAFRTLTTTEKLKAVFGQGPASLKNVARVVVENKDLHKDSNQVNKLWTKVCKYNKEHIAPYKAVSGAVTNLLNPNLSNYDKFALASKNYAKPWTGSENKKAIETRVIEMLTKSPDDFKGKKLSFEETSLLISTFKHNYTKKLKENITNVLRFSLEISPAETFKNLNGYFDKFADRTSRFAISAFLINLIEKNCPQEAIDTHSDEKSDLINKVYIFLESENQHDDFKIENSASRNAYFLESEWKYDKNRLISACSSLNKRSNDGNLKDLKKVLDEVFTTTTSDDKNESYASQMFESLTATEKTHVLKAIDTLLYETIRSNDSNDDLYSMLVYLKKFVSGDEHKKFLTKAIAIACAFELDHYKIISLLSLDNIKNEYQRDNKIPELESCIDEWNENQPRNRKLIIASIWESLPIPEEDEIDAGYSIEDSSDSDND